MGANRDFRFFERNLFKAFHLPVTSDRECHSIQYYYLLEFEDLGLAFLVILVGVGTILFSGKCSLFVIHWSRPLIRSTFCPKKVDLQ